MFTPVVQGCGQALYEIEKCRRRMQIKIKPAMIIYFLSNEMTVCSAKGLLIVTIPLRLSHPCSFSNLCQQPPNCFGSPSSHSSLQLQNIYQECSEQSIVLHPALICKQTKLATNQSTFNLLNASYFELLARKKKRTRIHKICSNTGQTMPSPQCVTTI